MYEIKVSGEFTSQVIVWAKSIYGVDVTKQGGMALLGHFLPSNHRHPTKLVAPVIVRLTGKDDERWDVNMSFADQFRGRLPFVLVVGREKEEVTMRDGKRYKPREYGVLVLKSYPDLMRYKCTFPDSINEKRGVTVLGEIEVVAVFGEASAVCLSTDEDEALEPIVGKMDVRVNPLMAAAQYISETGMLNGIDLSVEHKTGLTYPKGYDEVNIGGLVFARDNKGKLHTLDEILELIPKKDRLAFSILLGMQAKQLLNLSAKYRISAEYLIPDGD